LQPHPKHDAPQTSPLPSDQDAAQINLATFHHYTYGIPTGKLFEARVLIECTAKQQQHMH
jgi:hypothetical protein